MSIFLTQRNKLAYHMASWFKHLPLASGSTVRFQKKWTGTQAKMVLQVVQMKKTTTNAIRPLFTLRNHFWMKIRRHCSRMDILAAEKAV